MSVSLAPGGVRLLARCGGCSDWELCGGGGVGGGRGGGALGCDWPDELTSVIGACLGTACVVVAGGGADDEVAGCVGAGAVGPSSSEDDEEVEDEE